MCAGDGRSGPCDADQGGPLVEISTGILIGIYSWHHGMITSSSTFTSINFNPLFCLLGEYLECRNAGYPSVFTEVSHYIDWINDKISKY